MEYALAYAAHGYRVFPAFVIRNESGHNDKVPASRSVLVRHCDAHDRDSPAAELKKCRECRGGHHAATTDPDEIRRLWAARPRALVAILPPPGVLILDDDSHIFDVVLGGGPHVRTVSGKAHYYFRLAPDQTPLRSENGILFEEPDGAVDIRGHEGDLWIFAPCGRREYQRRNGFTARPDRLPELPAAVYDRLVSAPRSGGGAGGPLGKFAPGLEGVVVGLPCDYDYDAVAPWLVGAGWTELDDGDWMRPGGTRSNATLSERDGIWFLSVYTGSPEAAPLAGGHYYTAAMLRCLYEFAGHWPSCQLALLREGQYTLGIWSN